MKNTNIIKLNLYRDDKKWYMKIFFGLFKVKIAERNDAFLNNLYNIYTGKNNINQDDIPNLLEIDYGTTIEAFRLIDKNLQNIYTIQNGRLLGIDQGMSEKFAGGTVYFNYITSNAMTLPKRLNWLFNQKKPVYICAHKILKY